LNVVSPENGYRPRKTLTKSLLLIKTLTPAASGTSHREFSFEPVMGSYTAAKSSNAHLIGARLFAESLAQVASEVREALRQR
jgi:hypothetical protein